MLVSPTGASFGALDPARLSHFDAGGRLIGGDAPTKEMPLHSAFYDTRNQTGAVAHLHSTHSVAVGAHNIHVMAGFASDEAAHRAFVSNLRYAFARVAGHGIALLIEPLNHYDAPGYFLQTADRAAEIIAEINDSNLKLMFDCYHLQIMQGDFSRLLQRMLLIIGHIQIAAVPSRAEPDEGELDYRHILKHIEAIGYKGFIGAEYHPRSSTEAGLGWRALIG